MAANKGVMKAIVSFFTEMIHIRSLLVFLTIYVPEGINLGFFKKNCWKCWYLARKNVCVEERDKRLEKLRAT